MAKKKPVPKVSGTADSRFVEQPITQTLERNYMPYAMSVIVSRAIPEIDGFKPSHRKLLYTMYKMGLLTGPRTKSANVVGQTMKLNPHGDAAIYDTMVRLSRGYGALLIPYVDSKGNFGKVYSRDMACAAARYTEVKLDAFCRELFADIDKDPVDMVDNYDGTLKEPVLLPTTFPNLLVNANQGIAVGMASNICSFNLGEVCDTAIANIQDGDHPIASTLIAPDFSQGGLLLYDREELGRIYETGRGSLRLRGRYRYLPKLNLIEVTEIPYTTTAEAIIDKVIALSKSGRLREVADIRDETDLQGLRIAIELKRGVDPDKLMAKLFKLTPLEDSFACNFNILVDGVPRVMGIREILNEWTGFRMTCVRRRMQYDLAQLQAKLHLLEGLKKILLDIDRAIAIIRGTEENDDVVPNLMVGFGIDEAQAEYIAEIRLRALNRELVLKRLQEVDSLRQEIDRIKDTLGSEEKLVGVIVEELRAIRARYPSPRRTEVLYDDRHAYVEEEQVEDYPVTLFYTQEGYLKKITPQSLRMSGEQKLKEGDRIAQVFETVNRAELLVFTSTQQVYKVRLHELEDAKASAMGLYLPGRLGFDEGELAVGIAVTADYEGFVSFYFQNGKAARVPLSAYATKTNRKKLSGAYSDKSPLVAVCQGMEEVVLRASSGRHLIVNPAMVGEKQTRSTQGLQVMALSARHRLEAVAPLAAFRFENPGRYRSRALPAAGALLTEADRGEVQLSIEAPAKVE
ncbi:MAG: topoisomerase IV [Clostridiales bacterium]|nr:topoisomerase IV [Clostridiales bacterium]